MKNIISDFKTIFKGMNPVSKYAVKYGTAVILTLCAAAVFCLIKGTFGECDYILYYIDLLKSIKECFGTVYIMPLTAEIIFMARGKSYDEEPKKKE